MGKDDKYTLETAGPLNHLTARTAGLNRPATVIPQQIAFPIKTVWRVPIPLIKHLFGRTQVYRVISQVVVYPPSANGSGIDVDRAVVSMVIRRTKKPLTMKGAMEDDWNELWDAIEIMQKVNPKKVVVQGSRDDPPYEK